MADSSNANGANGAGLSFAEQMQKKHAEAHNPTVEEVVDEEDVVHPPPSLQPVAATETSEQQPLSEKAKGKQPAKEAPAATATAAASATAAGPKIDTSSEDMFPTLGGAPKKTFAPQASAWGSGKPVAVASNGKATGPLPRVSSSAIPAGPAAGVNLPGRTSQELDLKTSQMVPAGQRKKPIDRMLRDIEKKIGGVQLETKPTADGIRFVATGKQEKLQPALLIIAKELGANLIARVSVPVSVKPFLIGRGGANIKHIQETTGARINVPKSESNTQAAEDDEDPIIEVTIEGNAVAAEQARRLVEAIVNERTSTLGTRLRDIPPELYPFIAGPRGAGVETLRNGLNLDIKVPQYTSRHRAAPQLVAGQSMQFAPHPTSHISLSGDRAAVQQARAQIEQQVAQLRNLLAFEELSLPRGQHQLILGDDNAALHDLLEETGCTIILPPDDEDTEVLHVVGPQDRIEAGRDKIYELASAMSSQPVDIGRAHPGAPEHHARHLARYLQEQQAFRELENKYKSKVVLPPGNAPYWELYSGNNRGLLPARNELLNIVGAHPPQRFLPLQLDPYYHDHLREEHARRIRQDHGVRVLFPEDDGDAVVLVFEAAGTPPDEFVAPRQKPTPAELKSFQQALLAAQAELLGITDQHGPIQSRGVDVPRQYQDKVRKFVKRQQTDDEGLPFQLFNPPAAVRSQNPQQLFFRGPERRIDPFLESIVEFIEQEKRDEKERGYTTSFDFPQKFANHLIGRGGEGINKLRDEFDVEIQVRDGKVELKGPQAKAEAAKQRILNLAKRLEDETTHVLSIPRTFHPELIGAKGSQVNRLQDRYKVRVQFPKSASIRDDESVAESESRARSSQSPDQILIRGPRKGADEARDELFSLFKYIQETSQTASVSVAKAQLPSIIGSGGREVEKIRELTGAKIDIPNRDNADANGRVEVQLKGTKKQVEDAKKLLSERSKDFDDRVSRVVKVPKKYLQSLIGAGGNNIRGIMIAAGVPDDRQELARAVRFPDAKSESEEVRVEQKKNVAEKIVLAIENFVKDREGQVTDHVEIPTSQHRLLIGQAGATRRQLEQELKVTIDIPKQGSGSTAVKLVGLPINVAAAKEALAAKVKQEEGVEIAVPRNLHHAISDNGRLFGRLRGNHSVRVDHGAHKPPAKPQTAKPRGRGGANGSAMPLITDDAPADVASGHSWEIIDTLPAGEEGHIPWILRGSPENVSKAQAVIMQAISEAQDQDAAGYLILPDPGLHKLVIGQGGATINSIRRETGCRIQVPKQDARDEAIEILGSRDNVEKAKDRIFEAIEKGASGPRGNRRGGE